jgi:uncharacterized membrane protein
VWLVAELPVLAMFAFMLFRFVFYLLKLFGKISHNNNLNSEQNVAFLVLIWLVAAFWLWLTAQVVQQAVLRTQTESHVMLRGVCFSEVTKATSSFPIVNLSADTN